MRRSRRERIHPFREPGASSECMNAFPTRGGGCFGYDEAPVRGTQCVQSVGAGLLDFPAGCIQHDNRGRANPWPVLLSPGLDENEPCTRAGGDACPYERRWAFRL